MAGIWWCARCCRVSIDRCTASRSSHGTTTPRAMETLQQERELWEERARGVATARERLIERYLPLAKHVAARLYAARAVPDVEFGDYLHLAYVGLLEAMERYRAGGDAQFATFATYRIRGAILNNV